MISSAEITRRIIAAPAPILLLDSCAIFDLMRDPTRGDITASQVKSADRLLQMAKARPRSLWLPITDQVWKERQDNQANIQADTEDKLRTLEKRILSVQDILSAHGLVTTAINPSLANSQFGRRSAEFVDSIFHEGHHVRNGRNVHRLALVRMAENRAPSKKGQQTKDCLVIENYLQLSLKLRDESFLGKIVFLTVNKNDYSDPRNKAKIHPDLQNQFSETQLDYAVNFEMAEHLLR